MDAFAAAHDGLAPVVVVPDVTGSSLGNTLCVDSRLGAAETYVAEDVPGWVGGHLEVDMTQLAIGGFSFGGTCALQLALRRPEVYRTFLDVSGQSQPTLGDLPRTVTAAFAGDIAAFQRVDPLSELRARTYPGTAGLFVVGRDDGVYRPQAEQVAAAAKAAGVAVTLLEVPGEHSWAIATHRSRPARCRGWPGGRDPRPGAPADGQRVPVAGLRRRLRQHRPCESGERARGELGQVGAGQRVADQRAARPGPRRPGTAAGTAAGTWP